MYDNRVAISVKNFALNAAGWTTVYTPPGAPLDVPVTLINIGNGDVLVYTSASNDDVTIAAGGTFKANCSGVVKAKSLAGVTNLQVIFGGEFGNAASGGSSSGSGVSGGGAALWSVGQNDITAVRASDTTLTIGSIPAHMGVIRDEQFAQVVVTDSTGKQTSYVPSKNAMTWASPTLTVDGGDFNATDLGYDVFIWGPPKAYSAVEDTVQHYRTNPEHAWKQHSILVDVLNGADNSPAGLYYYVDFDMYARGGLQLDLDCDAGTVTATVEASFQDDGTAQAACAYQDVTNDLFGVASLVAAAGPASDMWIIRDAYPAKFLRLHIVANTGANTGDWTCHFRGIY